MVFNLMRLHEPLSTLVYSFAPKRFAISLCTSDRLAERETPAQTELVQSINRVSYVFLNKSNSV